MKKTHNLKLSDKQLKLLVFALGYTEGGMRRQCQFQVSDAVELLLRKLRKFAPAEPQRAAKKKAI